MASTVGARSREEPFRCHRVLQLAASLPPRLLLRTGGARSRLPSPLLLHATLSGGGGDNRKRKALSNTSAAASTTNVSEEATAAQKMTPEFNIAKHLLLSKETNGAYKNVVFSPLCIKLLLSIVAVGCNGPVRDQLLSFLQSESIDDLNSVATRLFSSMLVDSSFKRRACLSFASGVWVEKSLCLKSFGGYL
ncbi:hypothetical protein PIB30_008294 [Stylosanthes scabra]|uniref:Serpin domain-containing protein n=1 Tax=Stylosanthes scabra TaxID=79078 RepID=A0ABU6S522_9FABA|nr:hypothetical protein [Stylosanthes scabra]